MSKNYKVYIVWSYINGNYYIKLNDIKILKEWRGTLTRWRGCEETSDVYFIPNNILKKIKNKNKN